VGFASLQSWSFVVGASLPRQSFVSLHRATAQMAVNAQMQRHKWLSMHKWLTTCTGALPQSKDACSQPHKATMQGRIMTATQSRYARMHKDSHTKPLHDATAQMAVNAQMQRHKQLTLQRCKTNRASNTRHPHFYQR